MQGDENFESFERFESFEGGVPVQHPCQTCDPPYPPKCGPFSCHACSCFSFQLQENVKVSVTFFCTTSPRGYSRD